MQYINLAIMKTMGTFLQKKEKFLLTSPYFWPLALGILDRSRPNRGLSRDAFCFGNAGDPRPGAAPEWLRRQGTMKNRREWLLMLTSCFVAFAVIITPAVAIDYS